MIRLRHVVIGLRCDRIERAGGAAPVAGDGVAVVALLVAGEDAVAALLGDALGVGGGALPSRLDLAGGGAAVAGDLVAVVAGLAAGDLPVAADDRGDAGSPCSSPA